MLGDLNGRPLPASQNAVVIKYDNYGRECWAVPVKVPGTATARSIAVADGKVYVAGAAGGNGFIARLCALNGTTQKLHQIKRLPDPNLGRVLDVHALAIHPNGNIICAGLVESDGWVASVKSGDLSFQWHLPIRTRANDYVNGIAIDSHGLIHAAGSMNRPVGDRLSEAFLVKVSSTGKQIGDRFEFGTEKHDGLYDIAVDHRDRVVVSGRTGGSLYGKKNHGREDAFVARFIAID